MNNPPLAPSADQLLAADEATVFDQQHPPRNRLFRPDLSAVQLAVASVGSEHVMDANEAVRHAYEESLTLGAPCAVSDLSGRPAYGYATCDVTLSLTRAELYRLMRHDLQPAEFMALRNKYGVFYDIHDDFYDGDTGEALSPFAPRHAEAPAAPGDIG